MNKVILIGRLVKQPELKRTNNDLAYCQFTLAVNRSYKNANGEKQADFINCVAWRQTAELIGKYCNKGSQIGVEGEIQVRTYDDQNGKRNYITEVVVSQVYFLDSKKEENSGQAQPSYNKPNVSPQSFNQPKQTNEFDSIFNVDSDDLPF